MALFMPPLRERGGDILLLAGHYLGRACAEYHLPLKVMTEEAQAALLAYAWPGNVRELANMLERVALLSGDESIITPDLLGLQPPAGPGKAVREPERSHLKVSVEGLEREKLRAVLGETDWNVSLAAVRLGLPLNTLRYRIAKLELYRGKIATVLAPGRKPPGKVRERSKKVGPGAPAWIEGTWQPRRGIYLSASVSQVGADPGQASRVLESVADKVRRFGGRVEAMTAAELLASFGFDDSTEDGPSCAANAALAVQKAGADGYQDGSGPFTVQLALHMSTARVRDGDDTPETTGAGHRTGAVALGIVLERSAPQSIVVAAAAARLLHPRVGLEPGAAPGGGWGRWSGSGVRAGRPSAGGKPCAGPAARALCGPGARACDAGRPARSG